MQVAPTIWWAQRAQIILECAVGLISWPNAGFKYNSAEIKYDNAQDHVPINIACDDSQSILLLYMQDNNRLTGTIPTELGNLKLLSSLNLSECILFKKLRCISFE